MKFADLGIEVVTSAGIPEDSALLVSGLEAGPPEVYGDKTKQEFRWRDAVVITGIGTESEGGDVGT
ncbi:MAG: hypothetical protein DRQ56_10720 [Gammaproteobacteria bacterium]|nr:MAG: hypothetical protein DRQ56_10720 [Gammaproteobacteria bacterium]